MLQQAQPLFSRRQEAFTLLLVTYVFMFVLMVVDIADILYSPTANRITAVRVPFEVIFTITKHVDQLVMFVLAISISSFLLNSRHLIVVPTIVAIAASVWIATSTEDPNASLPFFVASPLIVAAVVYATRSYSRFDLKVSRKLVYMSALKFAIGMEAFGIIRWILFPIFPSAISGDLSWRFTEVETKVFYLLGFASPFLLVAVSSSYLVRYIMTQFLGTGRKVMQVIRSLAGDTEAKDSAITISTRALLIAALTASVILPIYPYIPTINPDFKSVSTDVFYYTPWMETVLDSDGLDEFAENIFVNISGGDRPLSLLVFFALTTATGAPLVTILQLMPVILTPALTATAYYFVLTGSKNKQLAVMVALIVPFSTTVIVGIYAGFYANWMAIIFSLLAFSFLLKFLESGRKSYLPVILGFIIAILFAHNYTWSYMISALVLFSVVYGVIHRRRRGIVTTLVLVGIVIAISISVDLSKMAFLRNDSGLDKEIAAAANQIAAEEFTRRWNNLNYVFTIFLGGDYTNSVIYALALVWMIGARYKDDNMNLAIMAMTFVGVIALFAGEYSVQSRVLWNIPIFIPAGIVLYNLIRQPASLANKAIFIAIMIYFGNYALRSLANLQLPS